MFIEHVGSVCNPLSPAVSGVGRIGKKKVQELAQNLVVSAQIAQGEVSIPSRSQ